MLESSGLSIRNDRDDGHPVKMDINTTGRSSSSSSSFNDSAKHEVRASSNPSALKSEAHEEDDHSETNNVENSKVSVKDEADHNGEMNDPKPEVPVNIDDIPTYLRRNGWESPPSVPVKGMVQPRVVPPPGKPTKHTNQLDYLYNTVLKAVKRHSHAWPFVKPVNIIELNIPAYFDVVKRPMDLGTIESRLKNKYYINANECLKDLMTVFTNCYTFNKPDFGVYTMAQTIEQIMLKKLENIPNEVSYFFRILNKFGTIVMHSMIRHMMLH
jgi:hypothetical protein